MSESKSLLLFRPHLVQPALDRLYLRLWKLIEARAFERICDRWPTEWQDYKSIRPGVYHRPRRGEFLHDAYLHLVGDRG